MVNFTPVVLWNKANFGSHFAVLGTASDFELFQRVVTMLEKSFGTAILFIVCLYDC